MQIESANKQHPIPQNVMDVEFKLIGDLTVRQFSYLVVFGILILITFKISLPGIFKYPLLLIETLAGLGFAFFPMNDITLDKWVINYINAIKNPRLRVWQHTINIPTFFTLDVTRKTQSSNQQPSYNQKRVSIDDFFASQKDNNQTQTPKDFDDDTDLKTKEQEFFNQIGVATKPKKISDSEQLNLAKSLHQDEHESKQQFVNHTPPVTTNQLPITPSKDTKPENKIEIKVNYSKNMEEMNQLKDKLIKEIEKNKYKVIEGKEDILEENSQQVPQSNVKVVTDKAEKVGLVPPPTTPTIPALEQVKPDIKVSAPVVEELTTPVKDKEKEPTSVFSSFLHSLKSNKQKEGKEIKEKPKTPDNNNIKTSAPTGAISTNAVKANIIIGTVEDKQGNLLPDCIVIIKDSDNEPMRALKTNNLWQFESSTSLENADYRIEGIKEGYKFTPVAVSALGKALDPVKLIGEKIL